VEFVKANIAYSAALCVILRKLKICSMEKFLDMYLVSRPATYLDRQIKIKQSKG
jgi:hypothetical protein